MSAARAEPMAIEANAAAAMVFSRVRFVFMCVLRVGERKSTTGTLGTLCDISVTVTRPFCRKAYSSRHRPVNCPTPSGTEHEHHHDLPQSEMRNLPQHPG